MARRGLIFTVARRGLGQDPDYSIPPDVIFRVRGRGTFWFLECIGDFCMGEHLCVNHSPLVNFVIKFITVLFLISLLPSVNFFCLDA